MVRIARPDAPAGLLRRQAAWTDRWRAIREGALQGEWATTSAKKLLREALLPVAHGKCAFCESTLGVTSYPEIEHYAAKTLAPNLCFEWTNLLPACRRCNGAKADQEHRGVLLKPDSEDPEPFFWIDPGSGKLEPHPNLNEEGKRRAEETIRICNLQRGPLCVKRAETLVRVGRWLRSVAAEGLTVELRQQWGEIAHPATEYKLVVRWMLDLAGLPLLAGEDRRRFQGR